MNTGTEPERKSLRAKLRDWPQHPEPGFYFLFLLVVISIVVLNVVPWPEPGTTPRAQARDAAAQERAQTFVQALGFEPGPAVCRTLRGGSGWCTVRVAGTDKTFSLFCSYRHPTCVENIATFKW